jgi:dynein light chain Tctex-type 1
MWTKRPSSEHRALVQITGEVLDKKDYVADEIPELSGEISERCLARARELCPTYKIVVNVSILQRTGSGLHTCSACFWDRELDSCCSVRWESTNMYAIIAIFGVSV